MIWLTDWLLGWLTEPIEWISYWLNGGIKWLSLWICGPTAHTHSSPLHVSALIMRSSRTKAASAQRSVSIVMQSTSKQQKPWVLSLQLCEQMPWVQLEEWDKGLHFRSLCYVGLLKSFFRGKIKITRLNSEEILMMMTFFYCISSDDLHFSF